MTAPVITSPIHAAVRADDAGVIISSVNIISVTRVGVGNYDIVLGSPIDSLQRYIMATTTEADADVPALDLGGETDLAFTLLTFNAGLANDAAFNLIVFRADQPS